MTIAENIRKFRRERGLTQKQLGEKCGMYESQIRKYELGTANPKIDTIKKIADVLNISIDRLTGDSVSCIIENRLKEIDKTLAQVAKEADVPLIWLQNIDSFIPGDMDFILSESRELEWNDTIGEYTSYKWITRVADVLGLPGSVLRTALARQEIPVPDDLPHITAEEAFGGENTYNPQGIGEPEPLSIAEKDHINKYRFISTHSPDGAGVVDTVLDREYAIAGKLKEQSEKIIELTEIPRYVKEDSTYVNAAHADDYINAPEELRQLEEDIMDDENF